VTAGAAARRPGIPGWRLAAVVVAALAINVLIFSLADLLTMDRPLDHDITDPIPVNLVAMPAPETPELPEEKRIPEPKPRPRLDFQPQLTPPLPGAVSPELIQVEVSPDFSTSSFDAAGLVFDGADLDTPPRALPRAAPPFPYRARQRNVSGSVTVKLKVLADGSVTDIQILDAQPKGYFEETVLRTVPTWRFEPGRIAGEPVASWVVTTIQFDLSG